MSNAYQSLLKVGVQGQGYWLGIIKNHAQKQNIIMVRQCAQFSLSPILFAVHFFLVGVGGRGKGGGREG